jgi:AP-4 complex subunit beta-1
MAFMAISTFQKDCKHSDPKIRGFALRNLCSLRFSGAIEFLMPAIKEALTDIDAYVRKTAIIGCVKVFYMQPE